MVLAALLMLSYKNIDLVIKITILSLTFQLLSQFDVFFTGIFTLELFLKLVTYGFVLHQGAFLRSAFNVLDMLVVCVSLISMSFK
jgi:hypothetical protein